jgi:hypothetical protein
MEQPKPQANSLLIAVDNSHSMQALIRNGNEEAFRSLIADDASWLVNATETYRVRKYLFDSEVIPADSLTSWTGGGSSSSLDRSMRSLSKRYRDQPVAGIILLTDGRSTDRPDTGVKQSEGETETKIPIYPVRIGALRKLRDLKIDSVSVSQSEFETAPVTMTAVVLSNRIHRFRRRCRIQKYRWQDHRHQESLAECGSPFLESRVSVSSRAERREPPTNYPSALLKTTPSMHPRKSP